MILIFHLHYSQTPCNISLPRHNEHIFHIFYSCCSWHSYPEKMFGSFHQKFTIITLWNKISFHPFSPHSLKVTYSSTSWFCSLQLCMLTDVWSPHTAAVCLGPTQKHSVKWYSLCSPLASTAPESHPSSLCLDTSANGLENVFHLFFRGWGMGISHLTFSQEALEKNSSYYCELLFNIYYS